MARKPSPANIVVGILLITGWLLCSMWYLFFTDHPGVIQRAPVRPPPLAVDTIPVLPDTARAPDSLRPWESIDRDYEPSHPQ